MHRARVLNEIETGPGISGKEFSGEQVPLHSVAAAAGSDEVAGRVLASFGERENVVDCGEVVLERGGAIDAATAAVTHHGVLDRTLLVAARHALGAFGAAGDFGKAWQANMVIVSTPRQFHLAENATPRNGSRSRGGASRKPARTDVEGPSAQAARAAARLDLDVAVEADS
jgi:hypothetical protein